MEKNIELGISYGLIIPTKLESKGYRISNGFVNALTSHIKTYGLNLDPSNLKNSALKLYDILLLSLADFLHPILEEDLFPLADLAFTWFCENLAERSLSMSKALARILNEFTMEDRASTPLFLNYQKVLMQDPARIFQRNYWEKLWTIGGKNLKGRKFAT